MPRIRPAAPPDAAALAELAERTFRDAFGAMNTPENVALHCATHYGEPFQTREILDPSVSTLVCEQEGQLIGYVQLRWGAPPVTFAALKPLEIQRLYVDRRWHGSGVAQSLMAAAFELAERGAADQIWLGVWEHNPRATAFYRKCGFTEIGQQVFLLGNDAQRDLVMAAAVDRGIKEVQ